MSSSSGLLYDNYVFRRDLAQQIHDVLVVCRVPRIITKIMLHANLSAARYKGMVGDLVTAGFMEVSKSPMRHGMSRWAFKTTPAGEIWILKVEELYDPFIPIGDPEKVLPPYSNTVIV